MNVREKGRQCAVASECENHSRRAENIAGDESERGDGRAGPQNRAANVAKKFRRRFRERRVGMIRKIGAKRSLSYKLDHDVNNCSEDECEIRGTRNGARRIFHFAARNQCHFDSDKGEHQQHHRVA